jgi:hypothetical protein
VVASGLSSEGVKEEMLLFGHVGITLGTAVLLNSTTARSYSPRTLEHKATEYPQARSRALLAENPSTCGWRFAASSLASRIDIRLLAIASLLPDIIDKPIGRFLLSDTFSNDRIFCHTLLFLIVITCVGLCLYGWHRRTWLLVLSFGTFTHLVLDQMWLEPRTLIWPLYGFAFERTELNPLISGLLHNLLAVPHMYVPEIVGVAILGSSALLLGTKKGYVLLRNGRTP